MTRCPQANSHPTAFVTGWPLAAIRGATARARACSSWPDPDWSHRMNHWIVRWSMPHSP